MELDEQLGRTTGPVRADSDTSQPTPSEGRQRWHCVTLESPHLPPDPFTISDDYGLDGAVGAWASPPLPSTPDDSFWTTTGWTEQRRADEAGVTQRQADCSLSRAFQSDDIH